MAIRKVWIHDAKTGEGRLETKDIVLPPVVPEPKGIDFDKLKALLQAKGLIQDTAEVE